MPKSPMNYKGIEDYINKTVAEFMDPISNVESIKCARRADNVYIELVHEDGDSRYFDITSFDLSRIGILVGHIIANNGVKNEIVDREKRKDIRRLFK